MPMGKYEPTKSMYLKKNVCVLMVRISPII
jgi:hypothetical protein